MSSQSLDAFSKLAQNFRLYNRLTIELVVNALDQMGELKNPDDLTLVDRIQAQIDLPRTDQTE